MLRTYSYYISHEGLDLVEVGHKYYFGELIDGSPVSKCIINDVDENNIGVFGGIYDDYFNEYLVTFNLIESDFNYLDSLVEIVDITQL